MRDDHVPTREFFAEEIAPLFTDMMSALLDSDAPFDRPDSCAFTHSGADSSEVELYVRLPQREAARIIGKNHSMRDALYHFFRAVCRNNGYTMKTFTISGLDENHETTSTSTVTAETYPGVFGPTAVKEKQAEPAVSYGRGRNRDRVDAHAHR